MDCQRARAANCRSAVFRLADVTFAAACRHPGAEFPINGQVHRDVGPQLRSQDGFDWAAGLSVLADKERGLRWMLRGRERFAANGAIASPERHPPRNPCGRRTETAACAGIQENRRRH